MPCHQKAMKLYVKSTFRDSNVFVNKDFQENHVLLLALQVAFYLTSCGARIVRMGGARNEHLLDILPGRSDPVG